MKPATSFRAFWEDEGLDAIRLRDYHAEADRTEWLLLLRSLTMIAGFIVGVSLA